MTYPPPATMWALCAVSVGWPMDAHGVELLIHGEPPVGNLPVPVAVLDELEARGWLTISEAGPVATVAGEYWLAKWMRAVKRGGTR